MVPFFFFLVVPFLLLTTAPDGHAASIRIKRGTEDAFSMLGPITLSREDAVKHGLPTDWMKGQLAVRTKLHWMVVPYKTEYRGLVIYSPGSKKYWPVTGNTLEKLQDIGVLPQSLPAAEPDMSKTALGINLFITGFILLFFLLVGVVNYFGKRNRKRLFAQIHEVTGGHFLLLLREILLNVAQVDGTFDERERQVIASILIRQGYNPQDVNSLMTDETRTATLSNRNLRVFLGSVAGQFSQDQIRFIIHAIVAVAAADGEVNRSEKKELLNYLVALGVSKAEAPKMLNTLLQNSVSAT